MTIIRTGLPPDLTSTEVISSQTIGTGGVTGSATDCWGYSDVNFWVDITAVASATRLDFTIEWSDDNTRWDPQHTEDITTGTSVVSDYLAQITIGSPPQKLHITLPTFGRRYCRLILLTDTSTLTASAGISRG